MKFKWWTLLVAILVLICFSWYLDHKNIENLLSKNNFSAIDLSPLKTRIDELLKENDSLNTKITVLTSENKNLNSKLITNNSEKEIKINNTNSIIPVWYINKELSCSMATKILLKDFSNITNVVYSQQFDDCMVGTEQNGKIVYYKIEDFE